MNAIRAALTVLAAIVIGAVLLFLTKASFVW